jgi:hypothetical protein
MAIMNDDSMMAATINGRRTEAVEGLLIAA